MKRSKLMRFSLAAACTFFLVTGTIANEQAVEVKNEVGTSVIGLGPAKIKDVSITDTETMEITGKVRKLLSSNVRGHVDFAVFDANGTMLQKGSVSYFPSLTGGSSRREARFHANLPGSGGKADLLVVAYHGKGGGSSEVYDCGDNMAVAE